MPFVSKKQQRFAFATKQPWAEEFASKTDFSKLPEKKKIKKKRKKSTLTLPIQKSHIEQRPVHGKYNIYFRNFNISDPILEKEQVEVLFDSNTINEIKNGFEAMKEKRNELRSKKTRTKQEDILLDKLSDSINTISEEAKRRFKKSEGMTGMTTTGAGKGVVTIGQGSYPKLKRRKKLKKSQPLSLTSNPETYLNNLSDKDKQMLRDAIVEEYKAVNIYEMMANNTNNIDLKKVFLDIAQEEKVHVGEFETLLNSEDFEHNLSVEEGYTEVEEIL